MARRSLLRTADDDVLSVAEGYPAVESVHWIGSCYTAKKEPGDVDVLIKLKTGWLDPQTTGLANRIFDLQRRHRDEKGKPLVNVFLRGTEGKFLDVSDLWFVRELGEDLQEVLEDRREDLREYIPRWRKAKRIAPSPTTLRGGPQ